jgi:TM2 domain-containing membrane protein YozV
MMKVLNITDDRMVQVGTPGGELLDISEGKFNFTPRVGDRVNVYGSGDNVIVEKAEAPPVAAAAPRTGAKSKMVAGLLGIFLGGIGIHSFYLGKTTIGVIQIVVSFVTCGLGSLWGFVEGILILCSKPGSSWHQDADGNELDD